MSRQLILTTALASLATSSPVLAETKPPARSPARIDTKRMATTPPPDLGALAKFYVGTWQCSGKITPAPGLGKAHRENSTTTWVLTLDGFWLAGTTEGEKIEGMSLPTAARGETRITYDRTARTFVQLGVSNRGSYGVLTSSGWDGDKLVWAGSISGLIKTETRSTISKRSETEYLFLAERLEAGKWVTAADETCTKK